LQRHHRWCPCQCEDLDHPDLTPYNAAYGAYIEGMYGRSAKSGGTFQKVPALGPMGALLVFHSPNGSATSYCQKGNWFVAFQGERGRSPPSSPKRSIFGTGDRAPSPSPASLTQMDDAPRHRDALP
jgi:hypothetical protein